MKNKGFTLVEMAVVLIIVSAISGMLISGFTTFMQHMYGATTHARQVAVKEALIGFLRDNKRLPCPSADISTGNESPLTSGQVCTSGAPALVPWGTLGIAREMAQDGWGNFFTYAVSNQPASPPDYPRNWVVPAFPGASINDIVVLDQNDNRLGAVVLIISHGQSGDGAWTENNTRLSVQPSEVESEKADKAAKTANSEACPRVGTDRVCRTRLRSDVFDDIVYVISKEDLVGPLYKQGALKTTDELVQAGCREARAVAAQQVLAAAYSSSYTVSPPLTTSQSDPMDNSQLLTCRGDVLSIEQSTATGSPICSITSGTATCRVILADIYDAVSSKGFKP